MELVTQEPEQVQELTPRLTPTGQNVVELVDHQHPHTHLAQQRDCQPLDVGEALPWPKRCTKRCKQCRVEPKLRWFRGHLHAHDRNVFAVCLRHGRVLPAEPFDNHRLAVVCRPDQQEVGHALFPRPAKGHPKALDGVDGLRIPDPPVRTDAVHPLHRRQPRHFPRYRVQMR